MSFKKYFILKYSFQVLIYWKKWLYFSKNHWRLNFSYMTWCSLVLKKGWRISLHFFHTVCSALDYPLERGISRNIAIMVSGRLQSYGKWFSKSLRIMLIILHMTLIVEAIKVLRKDQNQYQKFPVVLLNMNCIWPSCFANGLLPQ